MKVQKYEEFPLLPISEANDAFPLDSEEVAAEGSDPEAQHLLRSMSTADETSVKADVHTSSADDDVAYRERASSLVVRKAKAASDAERKMTSWQGLRLYPKAIAWSMLISLCIAMEGFDLCLLNTFCKLVIYEIALPDALT